MPQGLFALIVGHVQNLTHAKLRKCTRNFPAAALRRQLETRALSIKNERGAFHTHVSEGPASVNLFFRFWVLPRFRVAIRKASRAHLHVLLARVGLGARGQIFLACAEPRIAGRRDCPAYQVRMVQRATLWRAVVACEK